MANYAGPNLPETDTTTIPILLPWNRRNDQRPSIYVVSIHNDSPTASPRVEITPINSECEAGTLSSPPDTTPMDSHHPDEQPTKPTEEPTPTDFSTLAKLLDEIRQTQQCSHCQPPHRAKVSSVKVHPPSTLCYYHKQFGRAAVKCRTPCSQSGQQPRREQ